MHKIFPTDGDLGAELWEAEDKDKAVVLLLATEILRNKVGIW